MNLSISLSVINVLMSIGSAIGVFHQVGNWRSVVEKEQEELLTEKFGINGCCLRVRLSFSKACKKIDDWCHLLGVLAAGLIAVAVVCAAALIIVETLTAQSAAGVQQVATGLNNVAPASPITQPVSPPTTSPQNLSATVQVGSTSTVLCVFNAATIVLFLVVLGIVTQLKLFGAVLEAAYKARWYRQP